MDQIRMGLGTDQMALPNGLKASLPPAPRSGAGPAPTAMPVGAALDELAPWAEALQLPGVDT